MSILEFDILRHNDLFMHKTYIFIIKHSMHEVSEENVHR